MSLHSLVAESARRHRDRPAVAEVGGVTLTYGELDGQADVLAGRLASAGVTRSDRVVIWTEKSALAVVAMQAVLRLGAVYVPLDSAVPLLRAAAIARDCGATAVCSTGERVSALAAELGPGVQAVDLAAATAPAATAPAAVETAADEAAYILYTSGSTGTPKGVCISHGNAEAFVSWAVAELEAGPGDRFANHAAFSFDLSVLDLYGAFSVGASVHLVPSELAYAPAQLADFLRHDGITIWYSVPSALILMIRAGRLLDSPAPPALRALIFAGEPFPVAYVRRLAAWTGARLLNFYGPTETNVCTYHEVSDRDLRRDRPAPIGVACSGDEAWAELADGSRAGPGQEGELVVAGPTVMIGYWGQAPQAGPYRTGDLVRVLPDGLFDYVGRTDHMVKVRGHRIELGEVEAVLADHPGVDEAVVLVEDSGASARLTAFVVTLPGHHLSLLAAKQHCARRLPPYMLIDHLIIVPDLPRTPNGKADRRSLQARADGRAPAEFISDDAAKERTVS
jgi:amino acid adenylation domain-containing protein